MRYIFEKNNAQDLAETIIHALDGRNLSADSEEAYEVLAGRFSWETIAKLTVDLYRALLT